MRVSTTQFSNMMMTVMQRQSGDLARTFNDISSGKRIQQPSDDALATVKVQHLNKEIASLSQYISNVDQLEGVLQQEDTLLSNMVNVVQRARENVLLAGNGALDAQNLASLADEIDEQISELQSLGNYRFADGQYMFAGSNTLDEPITKNLAGEFGFAGDDKQRFVAISTSTKLASNDSGLNLFFKTGVPFANSTANITVNEVTRNNPTAMDEYSQITLTWNSGSSEWDTVATKWDGSSVNLAASSGSPISINSGAITADVTSGTLANGESFTIKTLDTFSALSRLSGALRDGSSDLQKEISSTLEIIDITIGSLGQAQTSVGGRLNTLESTHNSHTDVVLMDQVLRSELEDLDYSEAISRLNLQQTALTASQQTYVKIQGLSLFNFL